MTLALVATPPEPPPGKAVRVLVADAHSLPRAAVRALLELNGHMEVVGEAATGEEAVALAAQIRPDVALIDAKLPGLRCVEATRSLAAAGVPVMVLTESEREELAFAAVRAGASGLLHKDAGPIELARAIEVVAGGGAMLSSELTRRLMTEFSSRPEPSLPAPPLLAELTAREREVMGLVALGLSNEQIAGQLTITRATAKTHVSRTMTKLGARDRAQLVALAYRSGLVGQR
jgi:DNA-binding NarL/FixJ family response regulator